MSSSAPSSRGATAGGASPPSGSDRFRWPQLVRFAAVCVQLALLALVVRTFSIESTAFMRLLTIACAGFVVHHFAPVRLRLWVFVLVSFAGVHFVLGRANAAQILGLGLVLIGIAHLPIRFALRVVLILAAGAALAALRVGAVQSPLSNSIWPIFGAMFMFRMIVYLYDLQTKSAPFSPARALAYFFMLPNVCFPLFPVVDYKAFCRSHQSADDVRTYQKGVEWMFRGVVQLLLYRWVYQNLLVGADTVQTPLAAAQFIVTAYLMYLKISGSFHLIVGMLHLFGFDLGPTNNRYFLSQSFTDYWRRINIYWKDFLQKVIFNPVFFRLNKRMNGTAALVLATLVAFFATWALHSYQWFWIRGNFPVIWQDIVFWSMMGLLVLGNMLYENKYGRERSLSKSKPSLASEIMLALRTVGTFVVVCASWVIWSSETFSEFTLILSHLARAGFVDLLWMLGALAGLGVLAVVVARSERGVPGKRLGKPQPAPFWRPAYGVAASCVVILFAAYAPLVLDVNPAISNVVDGLKSSRMNTRDRAMMDRGYYEDLTNVARFNEGLGDLYAQKPPNWERCWALRPRDGFPDFEMAPHKRVWFKGAQMTTNEWGMRDAPYDLEKPSGTYRIAVTGASHDMGSGVEDHEVYDQVVEARLNAESVGRRYELLNFSVPGYGPLHRLADLDRRIFDFEPDALLYMGIEDLRWVVKDIATAVRAKQSLPFPYLEEVLRAEGIAAGASFAECTQKLQPRAEELLRWVYDEIVRRCNERGVVPMAGFHPHVWASEGDAEQRAYIFRQQEIAREAGMIVIDLTAAHDSVDSKSLWIAPWDGHVNAEGHRLLAEALHAGLVNEAGIGSAPARPGTTTERR